MNGYSKSWLGQLGVGTVGIAAVAALMGAFRGPSEVEKTKQNIVRVLQADQALSQQKESAIAKDAPASAVALIVDQYCAGLEKLDMSDCPADFRVAYREHTRAWRKMSAAINQIPDSFVDGFLIGFHYCPANAGMFFTNLHDCNKLR